MQVATVARITMKLFQPPAQSRRESKSEVRMGDQWRGSKVVAKDEQFCAPRPIVAVPFSRGDFTR